MKQFGTNGTTFPVFLFHLGAFVTLQMDELLTTFKIHMEIRNRRWAIPITDMLTHFRAVNASSLVLKSCLLSYSARKLSNYC